MTIDEIAKIISANHTNRFIYDKVDENTKV